MCTQCLQPNGLKSWDSEDDLEAGRPHLKDKRFFSFLQICLPQGLTSERDEQRAVQQKAFLGWWL
jgi:hypothetical protein